MIRRLLPFLASCICFFPSLAASGMSICSQVMEVAPDTFLTGLRQHPERVYAELEAARNAVLAAGGSGHSFLFTRARPVLDRIIRDIESRLVPGSVLEVPRFTSFRRQLEALARDGYTLQGEVDYVKFNQFVVRWVEVMDALLRSADPALQGTYHRDIAGPELKSLGDPSRGTYIFFSFAPVDDDYFLATRAAPVYLHGLMAVPPFTATAMTYRGGPLVPTNSIQFHIDGYPLDLEEFLKHDAGHSSFMRRRDTWLFDIHPEISRGVLVATWSQIERRIRAARRRLQKSDPDLAQAVMITLAEVIHERGYQYHLPMLLQQLETDKWTDVVRKKLGQRYWEREPLNAAQVGRLDEARIWLYRTVQRLLVYATIAAARTSMSANQSVLLRYWPKIQTYRGSPKTIRLNAIDRFVVDFAIDSKTVTTSIYEVSLAQVRVRDEPYLSADTQDLLKRLAYAKEKGVDLIDPSSGNSFNIASIEIRAGGRPFVVLGNNTVLAATRALLPESLRSGPLEGVDEGGLDHVLAFKLEQVLTLIGRQGITEFTITPPMMAHRGKVIQFNARRSTLTFAPDDGSGARVFPLSNVSL